MVDLNFGSNVSSNAVEKCVLFLEEGLARGESVRDALLVWYQTESKTSADPTFNREILRFLRQTEMSEANLREERYQTLFREDLFSILAAGVQGHAILTRLRELRTEIDAQLELDMKAHVESLPLKMLVPLLLCMFPAFLVLLLGPITRNLLEALR